MIQLFRITSPEKLNVDFKHTYESSFPEDERREFDHLLDLLSNKQFKLYEIHLHERFLGFISVWDLTGFNFIEHFAICATQQGKGYGAKVLNQILLMNSKPIILEVEEPFTETARRRISFYQRLNFSMNTGSYFQPPYSIGKSSIKMLLMSYPIKIETADFEEFKVKIHDQVYGYGG